jgi:hypothetical protein
VEVVVQAQTLGVQEALAGSLLVALAAVAQAVTELVAQVGSVEMALSLSTLGKQLCQFQINHPRLTIKSVHPR